jgi:hypothetical protein
MYMDSTNTARADKNIEQAEGKADKFEKKADNLSKKLGDDNDKVKTLRDKASALRRTVDGINAMKSDQTKEYRYATLGSAEANSHNETDPVTRFTGTNGKGDPVVTMFVEDRMGSELHESSHGGDIASGREANGVSGEVRATMTEFAWEKRFALPLNLPQITSVAQAQYIKNNFDEYKTEIKSSSMITPETINSIQVHNGWEVRTLYPPESVTKEFWNSH